MKERLDDGVTKSILADGTITYTLSNGMYHRTSGPAKTSPTGEVEYFFNGQRHRENGPAVDYHGHPEDYPDFKPQYWLNGFEYSQEQFETKRLARKVKSPM